MHVFKSILRVVTSPVRLLFNLILRRLGYTRVPHQVLQLVNIVERKWQADPEDPEVGEGLVVLRDWLRSAKVNYRA